jgi:hypothetical protein
MREAPALSIAAGQRSRGFLCDWIDQNVRASFLSALFRYTGGAALLARRFRLSDEEDCGEGVTGDAENEESTEQH